jgi:hypothetical protein
VIALAAALTLLASAEIRAVRITPLDGKPAVRVLTSEEIPAPDVVRTDEGLVVTLGASAPEALSLPTVEPPLRSLRVERAGALTRLHLEVGPGTTLEVRRTATLLTLVLSSGAPAGGPAPITPETYRRLFPAGTVEPLPLEEETEGAAGSTDGLAVGPFSLRPGLVVTYVDAEVLSEQGQPVRDRYVQIQPTLNLGLQLFDGRLRAGYEPRFRTNSSLAEVRRPSHFAGVRGELPVGPRITLRAQHAFATGLLETTEVDPGREYFYRLGRFRSHHTTVGGDVEVGPRLFAEAGGELRRVRFSTASTFTDYDERMVRGGLAYAATPSLRATLSYGYLSVPPAEDRPVIESTAHDLTLRLAGQLGPLLTGEASAGLRRQRAPRSGQRYSGAIFSAGLQRELGPSSALVLSGSRATQVSGFEGNAFYVSSTVEGAFSFRTPLDTSARLAAGYLWNDYTLPAAAVGVPREDRILGLSAGLGRAFGRHATARVDYRRDRRRSNVPGFDVTTDAFMVQLAIGFLGGSIR